MNRVYITDYITDPSIEKKILKGSLSKSKHTDIEVLLVWHQDINQSYINQFPNLKGIVRYGVGYDNIDLELLRRKNIIFCNNPDYGVDEVSDTAVAMTLNLTRRISSYDLISKANVNTNTWQELRLPKIKRLNQLRVGVIGAGRIGGSYLQKMNCFTPNIAFFDPYLTEGMDKFFKAQRFRNAEDLFKNCDIISLHCPLNKETRNLISKKLLSNVGKDKILINTARGELINDLNILHDAIENEVLIGVGLDVLPCEPPKSDNIFINNWMNNVYEGKVIINPHSAFYSQEAFTEMRTKAAQNAVNILNDNIVLNRIT